MHSFAKKGLALLIISSMISCTTYYIPTKMFREQYAKSDSSKSINLHYNGKEYFVHSAAAIQTIRCVDKNGNAAELQNGVSIKIRFTDNKNNKTVFYFDTIFMNDTL